MAISEGLLYAYRAGLDIDNVLVQNRFSQAQTFLPQDVKNFGVTIKKSLAFPLIVVSLYSPDGRYDASFLIGAIFSAIATLLAGTGLRIGKEARKAVLK